MSPSLPPPPPAIHAPAASSTAPKSAENYVKVKAVKKNRVITYERHEPGNNGHPFIVQEKYRHTNRLKSRKQAKLRAKRKAK